MFKTTLALPRGFPAAPGVHPVFTGQEERPRAQPVTEQRQQLLQLAQISRERLLHSSKQVGQGRMFSAGLMAKLQQKIDKIHPECHLTLMACRHT